MNIQLIANVENEDRAQRGKNEAGGMVSFVGRARKHVGNCAAKFTRSKEPKPSSVSRLSSLTRRTAQPKIAALLAHDWPIHLALPHP